MPPFAVYIHWPFCASKCPYCDFNSHPRPQEQAGPWGEALVRELTTLAIHHAERLDGRRIGSVFFGGGTPSRMPAALVADLLATLTRFWPLEPMAEITLEANPATADAARFTAFRAAGVNRLSLGVQALDDAALRQLGRPHNRAVALAAVAEARTLFPRVSCDLITARPGLTVSGWEQELAELLDRAVPAPGLDHLSVYALTLEPGTPFHRQALAGSLILPDEDTALALDAVTLARTAAAGLEAYEIANYARPGAGCAHNLHIWRSGDYLGLGPGAHGRLWHGNQRLALENQRDPEAWRHQVLTQGHGSLPPVALPPDAALLEVLLMGLRLHEGVAWSTLAQALAGEDPRQRLKSGRQKLLSLGLLEETATHIQATPAGRQCLNGVLQALI